MHFVHHENGLGKPESLHCRVAQAQHAGKNLVDRAHVDGRQELGLAASGKEFTARRRATLRALDIKLYQSSQQFGRSGTTVGERRTCALESRRRVVFQDALEHRVCRRLRWHREDDALAVTLRHDA